MRFVIWFVVLFNLLALGAMGGGACYAYMAWTQPGPAMEAKDIVIPRGTGVTGIASQLEKEGVIRSALLFRVAVRVGGDQGRLKAGEYEFPAGIKMGGVIDMMARGAFLVRKITIPEGLTSWQAVQIINKADALKGTISVIPAEGSLLPETYTYTRDQDRSEILHQAQDAMSKTMAALWPGRDPDLPFTTPEQAMTLASIVEKETGIASERPRIAGVFINRLKAGMPLQSDPTVIYALTNGKIQSEGQGPLGRRLLKKDLDETDSPYNTYKYPGLPPGPVANPGKAAIEAVLHPEHNNFLYFVANGTGGHVFASTLAEHDKNVGQWREIRKDTGN